MPPIKGWRKLVDETNVLGRKTIMWKKIRKRMIMDRIVMIHSSSITGWVVFVGRSYQGSNVMSGTDIYKKFRTFKLAIKFAISWMKKHPRG